MDQDSIKELLEKLSRGEISADNALERLRHLPFEDIGFASIDHHRGLRKGCPEVIFGQGKEVHDIIGIMERMIRQGENIMVTRVSPEKADLILKKYPK